MMTDTISSNLLKWFDREKRDLPKRFMPWRGVNNAYFTWLSEVMLQQTTVKTVAPYFLKFITNYPTLKDLANAPQDQILRDWAGLGYYARARNMHACAKQIMSEFKGEFPISARELAKLKGIGAYTSAAIAAIAFGEPIAVLDGNVERVWSRLHCINGLEIIRVDLQEHVPLKRAGDFAESLMDLGATICTPRNPLCAFCPLESHCQARLKGVIDEYPAKKVKAKSPVKCALVFIVMDQGRVLVETRPEKGLLGGMTGLPCSPWVLKEDFKMHEALVGITNYTIKNSLIRHVFTHFVLELTPVLVLEKWEGRYIDPSNHNEAFPTLFNKVLSTIGQD